MNISLARPLPSGAGRVSQWFGENPAAYKRFGMAGHNGVDYACTIGTPVLAAHEGFVTLGVNPNGYGTYVKVKSGEYETLYGHLSTVFVHEGDKVDTGTKIGLSGNTGNSTGPHLHFELRVTGMRNPAYAGRIDPVPFRDVDNRF